MYRLNLVTETWTQMSNMTIGDVVGATARIFDGKIHLFNPGDRRIYVYDDDNDDWVRKPGTLPYYFKEFTNVVLVDDSIINC